MSGGSFFDLETLVNDAHDTADVLFFLASNHFSEKMPQGGYRIYEDEAQRLFFMAGLVIDAARKTRDAYYAAHENQQKGGANAGAR